MQPTVSQQEIDHLRRLLDQYRANLRQLLAVAAGRGGEENITELELFNNIATQREHIDRIMRQLRSYGILVDDKAIDSPPLQRPVPPTITQFAPARIADTPLVEGTARNIQQRETMLAQHGPTAIWLGVIVALAGLLWPWARRLYDQAFQAVPSLIALVFLLFVIGAMMRVNITQYLMAIVRWIVEAIFSVVAFFFSSLRPPTSRPIPVTEIRMTVTPAQRPSVQVLMHTDQHAPQLREAAMVSVYGRRSWWSGVVRARIIRTDQVILYHRQQFSWAVPTIIVWVLAGWAWLHLFVPQTLWPIQPRPTYHAVTPMAVSAAPNPSQVPAPTTSIATPPAPATQPVRLRRAQVVGVAPGRLYLRAAPTQAPNNVIAKIEEQEFVELLDGTHEAEGITWQQVRYTDKADVTHEGWVALQFLREQ